MGRDCGRDDAGLQLWAVTRKVVRMSTLGPKLFLEDEESGLRGGGALTAMPSSGVRFVATAGLAGRCSGAALSGWAADIKVLTRAAPALPPIESNAAPSCRLRPRSLSRPSAWPE